MRISYAISAVAIAFAAAAPLAAHAASNPAQDQAENRVTAQLNEAQIQGNGGYGVMTYEGIMHSPSQYTPREQIAQPPDDSGNLSIIE